MDYSLLLRSQTMNQDRIGTGKEPQNGYAGRVQPVLACISGLVGQSATRYSWQPLCLRIFRKMAVHSQPSSTFKV